MATSNVEICNLALTRLGQSAISSLTEPSKEARTCKTLYDRVRRSSLVSHPWNFATTVITLAVLSDVTDAEWDFVYQKPSDCLRVIEIPNVYGDDVIPHEVREGQILTDLEEATLRYIKDVSDPNKFSEQFIEAVSYRLAADLAMPLTGKPEYMQAMMQQFYNILSLAKGNDAREGRKVKSNNRDFIDARGK